VSGNSGREENGGMAHSALEMRLACRVFESGEDGCSWGRGVWSVADGRRERGSMDGIGKEKKKNRIGDQCKLQAAAAFAFSLLLASALLLICFSRTHPNTCSNKIHISTFLPLSFLCFLLKKILRL
jgi:hypothetical protein